MAEESSFQKGFGGSCGVILGVAVALTLVPLLGVGGCLMLGTGAAIVVSETQNTVERAKRDGASRQPAIAPREPAVPVEPAEPSPDPPIVPAPVSLSAEGIDVTDRPTPDAWSDDWRVWTDATGAHTVEATFVKRVAGTVTLRKSGGAEIRLSIDRLSQEDQEWLRQRSRLRSLGGAR